MRRGELSLQMIIIAILVLIVLIVMVVVFTGKLSVFSKGTATCAGKGGQCLDQTAEKQCPSGTTAIIGGGTCINEKQVCCVQLEAS